MSSKEEELAIRVVNLRRALATANTCLREHGQTLLVGCDELAGPTFREGRSFWSKVRITRSLDASPNASYNVFMTTKRTAIGDLLSDARVAGMEVIDEGISYCIVAKRHARTGAVLRGIRIYQNNTALDLTVDLAVAKAMRSTAAMRKALRLA